MLFSNSSFLHYNLLSLGNSLVDSISLLLLEQKNLEALKVSKSSSSLSLGNLLSPSRLGPLGVNLRSLPLLSNGRGASSTGELGNDVRSQDDVSKSNTLAGDTGGRTVNENLQKNESLVILILDDLTIIFGCFLEIKKLKNKKV